MAATAYASVRRCSMSSTGSSGSDDSDAEVGASKTGATRYMDVDGDDYEGHNKCDDTTKDEALSSSSSPPQPSFSAAATPSPANFLSRPESNLTPMSMDSDLFPDCGFGASRREGKTSNPTPYTQQQQQQSMSPASMIPISENRSSSSLYAVQRSHGDAHTNTRTTSIETASTATSATAAMRLPHASATCPAAAAPAASAVAVSAAGNKQGNVSGARQDDATEIEAKALPSAGMNQSRVDHHDMGVSVTDWNDDAREGNKGEEAAAECGPLTISPIQPRQRRAGTTPLSLDALQMEAMVRGGQQQQQQQQQGDNDKERDSAPLPPAQPTQTTPLTTGGTAVTAATASSSSSPWTENIVGNNNNTTNSNKKDNYSSAPNTSSAAPSAFTSPAASVSSPPSTVFSAPAAFTRQLSTTSLPSTTTGSLVSQIQENLQQQQNPSSSSAANLVRPVAKPIVRTTSDSNFTLKHPIPDLNCRSGAYTGNVAALEKSAERLSMTSSIEDAIRELHGELKRSDSRRSSILAANLAAAAAASQSQAQVDESSALPGPLRVLPPVASIVELNNAARLGGYSPSGYVMSPNHSLTSRMRSGSKNSTGRPEIDVDAILSRHGPGKGSSRSVRSARPSLAEIAESEPVALTGRVLDEADLAPVPVTAADDATIRRPNTRHDEDRSSYHDMLGEMDRQSSGLGLDFGGDDNDARDSDDRPPTPRSTSTFDHANVFGDFDGVHCQPEDLERAYDSREHTDGVYHEGPMHRPQMMPMPDIPEPQWEPLARRVPPPTNRAAAGRPQSYFDPLTGQEMLYYPARVPAMLNLPPKLSKKPKTEVRNARHSKVLQAMGHPGFGKAEYLPQDPETVVRESKMWLPDPLAGHGMTTFGDDVGGQHSGDASLTSPVHDSHMPSEQGGSSLVGGQSGDMPEQQPPPPTQQRRKSKMPRASQLPPQLRASAFFDLPSTTTKIEVKEGSPMATLDSILDASTTAPVSAFTDHAFAGKLGSEVYGPDKKNRKSTAPTVLLPEEHVRAASQKRKGGLMPFSKKSDDGSRKSSMADGSREENQGLSDHVDGDGVDRPEGEGSGDDGGEGEEEDEDEFAGVLDGPPTTLLAELQLRKYHAKMRTQNPNRNVGRNGMHATLIELDAVAEAQKRHREKKKIALAWEEGAQEEDASSDEDDVPLGVLYAHQPAIAEMNRPLGLMERRDQEENEPLSARRARLHGQEPPRTLAKQRSQFTLNAGLSQLRLHQMPSADHLRPREDSDDDDAVEGETLAERMCRLRAKDEAEHNNLPSARPVSKMFSAEILAQFGESDKQPEDKGKEVEAQPDEAEETLGQRRKRLQAEREAREREMMLSGGPVEPEAPPLRKKHSLADVLASHPTAYNPAWDEQRRLEEERRKVKDQEAKMAAVRAQMPKTLTGPNVQRTGGYMNGAFNDGSGGLQHHKPTASNGVGVGMGPGGWNRSSMAFSNYGAPLQQPAFGGLIGHAGIAHMSQNPTNAYAGYTAGGMGGANPYGAGMGMPMQMQPMGAGMGMQQGMAPMQMPMQPGHNGQMQSIERWRQSVMY